MTYFLSTDFTHIVSFCKLLLKIQLELVRNCDPLTRALSICTTAVLAEIDSTLGKTEKFKHDRNSGVKNDRIQLIDHELSINTRVLVGGGQQLPVD